MSTFRDTLEQLTGGEATVAIIGLGYVGLPLAFTAHANGLSVIGFDVDPAKIKALTTGESYLKHLGDEIVPTLAQSPRFTPTSDVEQLRNADAIIICVPTPLGVHQEPDLSFVTQSGATIGSILRPGQLIVLESTSYPGTTRDEMLGALQKAHAVAGGSLVVGEDYFVAFSPEREDPGRKGHNTRTIPKLVGGLDAASTELACALYRRIVDTVVPVRTAEIAEAAKILENVFRSVNIALVNELKVILSAMDIDVWEVIEAASTKPFGFMPFYPGPGLGGHCIPVDPFYLTWKAREHGAVTRFIELAGEINTRMPEYVVEQCAAALNDDGKALNGAEILVIGLAYKPDIDDTRESPAAEILDLLEERGARIRYHDPHVPSFPAMRKHRRELTSETLSPELLSALDCTLIVTNHRRVDYDMIGQYSPLVVDTRNAMKDLPSIRARVVKA
jgi:UDP-N-acetyl-D-glucosamine dehydrogenase